MKVLEYHIVSPVIDTNKMMQVDEFSTKVIVGLTKYEEEYICKRIDKDLDFDVLCDVIEKLNLVICLYVNKQYIISKQNNSNNIVRVDFKVKSANDILRHMDETNDESIVTTWLNLHNKAQKEVLTPVRKPERNHPIPQHGSRRAPRRNYRMVGESTKNSTPSDPPKRSTPWFAYVLATLAVIAFVILCFAGLGAAVFFLPLLAGAFAKK